ncbi:hypothetical protein SNEBB_001608 [Seison nebaliae]|nr:hypothetical protein SNEBB_001608 [Seison nebaliae]
MTKSEFLKNFQVKRKLNSGSFGSIYTLRPQEGTLKRKHDVVQLVAKIEPYIKYINKKRIQSLKFEYRINRKLHGGVAISNVLAYFEGQHLALENGKVEQFNILLMDRLGPSLAYLVRKMPMRAFSLKTILMITDQLISRLEWIHRRGIIHRDLKPENCVIGLGKNSFRIYIIDFGLAKLYDMNYVEIDVECDNSIVGTPRFASINAHCNKYLYPKDDMEALIYMLIFLSGSSLPWRHFSSSNSSKLNKDIRLSKESYSLENYPGAHQLFKTLLHYTTHANPNHILDYNAMRNEVRSVFGENRFILDYHYDWDTGVDSETGDISMKGISVY